jgi:diguanylate cyclase (GGDEF)-like protein/PAS domain S-box-containing protein
VIMQDREDISMDKLSFNLDDASLFAALMDNTADSIYFKDRQCRLVRISRKMANNLGFSEPDEIIGKTDRELFGEEFGARTETDDRRVMDTGQSIVALVESHILPDGRINWTSTSKLPLYDANNQIIGLLGITREINDLKQTEQELQFMATHDLLTSLPNHYLFLDRLSQALIRAKRQPAFLAILYIDLDDFKQVNDKFGHDTGDEVLKQVAKLIQRNTRDSDTIARLGGDEFAILMDTIHSSDEVVIIAERIIRDFNKGFILGMNRIKLTSSIGISIYPENGTEGSLLLKYADLAMYRAKKIKNTYSIYESL